MSYPALDRPVPTRQSLVVIAVWLALWVGFFAWMAVRAARPGPKPPVPVQACFGPCTETV